MACTYPDAALMLGTDGFKFLGRKYFIKDTLTCDVVDAQLFYKKFGLSVVPMPCGSCMGCRLDSARDFTVRGVCESRTHDDSEQFFLTLTYDEDHVPRSPSGLMSLKKSDVRLFFVRLREVLGSGLRTMGCAEYGPRTSRPHYHVLTFGKSLSDLSVYGRSKSGQILYESELVTRVWTHGRVLIGKVSYSSIRYVSGYIMKKQKGDRGVEYYGDREHEGPVAVTRNGGGIGALWLDKWHDDLGRVGVVVQKVKGQYREFPVPKYFRRRLKARFPEDAEKIRLKMQEFLVNRNRAELTIERQKAKALAFDLQQRKNEENESI